jgi:tRNA1Val (adenine37-N6)-methyltransferase
VTSSIPLHPDETLDDLRLGGLKIIQKRHGYRFSLDPILLCRFAQGAEVEAAIDLGTGSGVIPLVLARISAATRIVGVELQAGLADRARRSVELNGLAGRVEIVEGDVRTRSRELGAGRFDLVLSNPPFRQGGTGRIAPEAERAAARHELAGGLADFLRAAALLLRPGGRCCLIYLAERLTDLLVESRAAGLEPKRLRLVQSRCGEAARLVLVEARKGGRPGLVAEAPLLIYQGEGYSAEVLAWYGEG